LISPNQRLIMVYQSCSRGRCSTIGAKNDIEMLHYHVLNLTGDFRGAF